MGIPNLLHFEVILGVSQGEYSESAVFKVVPRVDDVGKQKGETAVVIQPPHVYASVFLLHRELVQVVDHLLWQITATNAPNDLSLLVLVKKSIYFSFSSKIAIPKL
jgi:hypothetical protein